MGGCEGGEIDFEFQDDMTVNCQTLCTDASNKNEECYGESRELSSQKRRHGTEVDDVSTARLSSSRSKKEHRKFSAKRNFLGE